MKVRSLVTLVLFACVLGVRSASAEDTNSKCASSGTEKKGAGRFEAADTNDDGVLSIDEFNVLYAERQAKMKEKLGDKYEERAAKMPSAEERFAKLDADKSGGVSKEEMKAGRKGQGKKHDDSKDDEGAKPKE